MAKFSKPCGKASDRASNGTRNWKSRSSRYRSGLAVAGIKAGAVCLPVGVMITSARSSPLRFNVGHQVYGSGLIAEMGIGYGGFAKLFL